MSRDVDNGSFACLSPKSTHIRLLADYSARVAAPRKAFGLKKLTLVGRERDGDAPPEGFRGKRLALGGEKCLQAGDFIDHFFVRVVENVANEFVVEARPVVKLLR